MRGVIHSGPGSFVFLDMSMIDTYTLDSNSLPAGTEVPVTVTMSVGSRASWRLPGRRRREESLTEIREKWRLVTSSPTN